MPRRLYSLLIYCALPVALGWLLWRGLRERGYWQALSERFGFGAQVGGNPIWVHAVSLGEVIAAAPLVRALRARHPESPLVLTSATPTGRARARALFPEATVRFLPYDTPGAVRRFLRRARPRFAVIMETELWPNLFDACRRAEVPVVLANARLSPKSVSSYRRLGSLIRAVFSGEVIVAAQTEADAARFTQIGAPASKVRTAGNIKFDASLGADLEERGRALRASLGGARPIWTAGSTHAGEDEPVLDAHRELLAERPEALLVLAPRHPDRFNGVAELLRARGLKFERRSREGSGGAGERPAAIQVFLLDSVGELTAFYAASDVVFVGGSLVPIGGHNLLEPAALGLPVLTGKSHENAREVAQLLLEQGAAVEVADAGALSAALRALFKDPAERARRGALGRKIVEANRGTVERLLDIIDGAAGRATPASGVALRPADRSWPGNP